METVKETGHCTLVELIDISTRVGAFNAICQPKAKSGFLEDDVTEWSFEGSTGGSKAKSSAPCGP